MSFRAVYVKTIGTCNLDCKHCFTNGKNGDPTQFDIDTTLEWIKDYAKSFPEGQACHFELHGGEPFLVKLPKLRSFVSQLRGLLDTPVTIGCTSNLSFPLTDDHVKFIKEELDGGVATSWDPYMRWETDKQYQYWLDSLAKLAENGVHPKVITTLSKELMRDYTPKEFCDKLISLGIKHIDVMRLTLDGSAACNAGGLFPDNDLQDQWFLELVKYYQLYEVHKDLVIYTIDGLISRLEDNRVEVGTNCRVCEQNLVTINANGTLSTCPNAAESNNYSHISLSAADFLTNESRMMSQAVEQDYDERCIACDVFDLCGGDCHKLPWDTRCGGWKRTLHHLSGRPYEPDLIFKG